MKTFFIILAVGVLVWFAASPSEASRGDVPFVDGYAAGLEKARGESKPSMLYITADW